MHIAACGGGEYAVLEINKADKNNKRHNKIHTHIHEKNKSKSKRRFSEAKNNKQAKRQNQGEYQIKLVLI